MDKALLILSLCYVLCALTIAQNDDGGSPDQWNEDSWYDDELEKLGIVSQSDENNNPDTNNENQYVDYRDTDIQNDNAKDENMSIESQMENKEADINDNENEEQQVDDAGQSFNDYPKEDEEIKIAADDSVKSDLLNDKGVDWNVPEEVDHNNDDDKLNQNNNDDDKFDDSDYQVEDNRSDVQDKEELVNKEILSPFNNDENQIIEETKDLLDEIDSQMIFDDDTDTINEASNDENNSKIQLEEVPSINDNKEQNEQVDENISIQDQADEVSSEIDNFEYIPNEDSNNLKENPESLKGEIVDQIESDDDTVAEALDDVKDDLVQLFDTIDKLTKNDDSPDELEEQQNVGENIPDYEEKYKRPFREGLILQQRVDYDEAQPVGFDDFEHKQSDESSVDDNEKIYDDYENDGIINDEPVKNEAIDNYNAKDLFKDDENNDYDNVEQNLDNIFNENKIENSVPYVNDALLDVNPAEEQNADNIESVVVSFDVKDKDEENQAIDELDTNQIEQMSSAELNERMTKFVSDHAADLDTLSVDFDKNVAPVYITLKLDEETVITSPNYPGAYPTNNIIDWILDSEGVGIEMNITDLRVNGNLGDYLLVKPGGVDETGNDGLIFSYHLKSERNYRFLDVNKMFVRFEAKPGLAMPVNQGFSMSVKLIAPLPEILEPMPEPEPIIEPPAHILMVYLGGVSPQQFLNISEEFRLIVSDMAIMYVNKHGVDVGETNITEATQITQVSTCNINWPGFESCAGITVGVPLDPEDDDAGLTEDQLEKMWRQYVAVDPFAARLRMLGIKEFAIPNDSTTLMVWLVIGCGVAISAGMLALALWRWSCFEDYTRMAAYSDTDSVISEKRGLDLYPTPHQAIPPLYDGSLKYEDTTRVDMGGFANRSFARDPDLFDIDSDEDLGLPSNKRDRSSNIQPKDIYPV